MTPTQTEPQARVGAGVRPLTQCDLGELLPFLGPSVRAQKA